MRRRALLIAGMFVLSGCVSAPAPGPVPNVYVMRHLHTPRNVSDPDLTSEGQAAAEALARWLSRDPPKVIFVSNTKRARQTAAPAAKRFGVVPKVYNPVDTPRLIASVLAEDGAVLVVGHSNTVPAIIAGLGGESPPPLVHEDFGDIWRIQGSQRSTFRTKLSQR